MKLRTALSLTFTSALCLALMGCSWFKTSSAQKQIALASTIAYEAAFIGVSLDLKAHPDRRASYQVAQGFLSTFITTNTAYADLSVALQKLPIKELQGENGAIIISGIVSIYVLAKDSFIDVANTPPWIAGVGGAIDRGIRDALILAPATLDKMSTKRTGFVVPRKL